MASNCDLAVFLAAGDLDLWRGDEIDVVLAHRFGQVLRDRVLQRLLAGGLDADPGFQDPAGGLAGSEPGETHLFGDLAERSVDVVIELRFLDRDRQLDLVALEGLQRALHRPGSVPVVPRRPPTQLN